MDVNFFDYHDDNLICPISQLVQANDKATLRTILSKTKKKPAPLPADNRGWTALHYAASQNESTECLDLLIKNKKSLFIDLNAESHEGETALFLACERRCKENVELLLEKGCNPKKNKLDGTSPLHISAMKGYSEIVKCLLNYRVNINEQDWQGFSPLHLAAMCGHVDVCLVLLQNNADIKLMDSYGNVPLHLACQNGHHDIIKIFIDTDVTLINYQNYDGMTPLMLAVKNHNVDCIRYLLDHGAKTIIANTDQIIPLQFAAVGGSKDVFDLIFKNTDLACVEKYCFYNFTQVLKNKGVFHSLVCCALNSGSIDCLNAILKSGLPKQIVEAPYAENCGYCLDIYSPLAYLFSMRSESVDETFDSLLRLMSEHDIIYMKEFFSVLKIEWPDSRVKFINPYSIIFSSEWPIDKKLPYFNLLNEYNISPDYCLICYNDNTQKFDDFTVLLGYLTFYKPVLDAVNNGDIETVKLFLSHSSILEPDQLCHYLVVMKSKESSKEFNHNLKKVRSMYHYLVKLKPSYYNYNKYPRAARFFESFSRDEEFLRSNLQQLCRSVIRRQVRGITLIDNLNNFKDRINKLPLPSSLKNFLLFKN